MSGLSYHIFWVLFRVARCVAWTLLSAPCSGGKGMPRADFHRDQHSQVVEELKSRGDRIRVTRAKIRDWTARTKIKKNWPGRFSFFLATQIFFTKKQNWKWIPIYFFVILSENSRKPLLFRIELWNIDTIYFHGLFFTVGLTGWKHPLTSRVKSQLEKKIVIKKIKARLKWSFTSSSGSERGRANWHLDLAAGAESYCARGRGE